MAHGQQPLADARAAGRSRGTRGHTPAAQASFHPPPRRGDAAWPWGPGRAGGCSLRSHPSPTGPRRGRMRPCPLQAARRGPRPNRRPKAAAAGLRASPRAALLWSLRIVGLCHKLVAWAAFCFLLLFFFFALLEKFGFCLKKFTFFWEHGKNRIWGVVCTLVPQADRDNFPFLFAVAGGGSQPCMLVAAPGRLAPQHPAPAAGRGWGHT